MIAGPAGAGAQGGIAMKNKDLSPVRSAAKQLAGLLPRPELPEGEMWQFFHFQTNDYWNRGRTNRKDRWSKCVYESATMFMF